MLRQGGKSRSRFRHENIDGNADTKAGTKAGSCTWQPLVCCPPPNRQQVSARQSHQRDQKGSLGMRPQSSSRLRQESLRVCLRRGKLHLGAVDVLPAPHRQQVSGRQSHQGGQKLGLGQRPEQQQIQIQAREPGSGETQAKTGSRTWEPLMCCPPPTDSRSPEGRATTKETRKKTQ